MIAIIADHNNVIIHATNIAANNYPEHSCDLFVHMSDAISNELLSIISQQNIFAHIYYIDKPVIDGRSLPLGRIPKIRMLFRSVGLKKYYRKYLDLLCSGQKYDTVLVHGFWGSIVFFVDYFFSINPTAKIILFDEGTTSQYFHKHQLAFYSFLPSKKARLQTFIDEYFISRKYEKKLTGQIYLYASSVHSADTGLSALPIKKITKDNKIFPVIEGLCQNIDYILLNRYERCKICFFARFEKDYKTSFKVVDTICDSFSTFEFIIKGHPNSPNSCQAFKKRYGDRHYVDINIHYFESLSVQADFNSKILVSFASSAMMYLCTAYGFEPVVILVFRLYPNCYLIENIVEEKMVADLRKLYSRPERVMVPNSFQEYRDMLELAKKMIAEQKDDVRKPED